MRWTRLQVLVLAVLAAAVGLLGAHLGTGGHFLDVAFWQQLAVMFLSVGVGVPIGMRFYRWEERQKGAAAGRAREEAMEQVQRGATMVLWSLMDGSVDAREWMGRSIGIRVPSGELQGTLSMARALGAGQEVLSSLSALAEVVAWTNNCLEAYTYHAAAAAGGLRQLLLERNAAEVQKTMQMGVMAASDLLDTVEKSLGRADPEGRPVWVRLMVARWKVERSMIAREEWLGLYEALAEGPGGDEEARERERGYAAKLRRELASKAERPR